MPDKFLLKLCTIFCLLVIFSSCKKEDSQDSDNPTEENWPTDDTRVVKSGLNFPWEILWGKDNYIWITERNGKISKIDPLDGKTLFTHTITDVVANGEGGLLGMVQHPDFLTNGQFFVVYNYNNGNYREKVVRFTFNNNSVTNPVTIIENIPSASIHNGARLVISNESVPKLFISTGDAANSVIPQETGSKGGKILRLNLDGSIPADNPIPGNPYWSLGHRNPQGLVLVNNILYSSEHGSDIEDEINIIEKGRNYGWPNVKGPCNEPNEITFCNDKNVKVPAWSSGTITVATAGIDYYNGDRIPQWKNSLLMATLKESTLFQLQLSTNGLSITGSKEYFRGNWGRLRDVCVSPAGRVYICTSNGGNNDRIIEIQKPA